MVELSGEQLELARTEAWSAASTLTEEGVEVLWQDGPALVIDAPEVPADVLAQRLSLAHRVSTHAISGPMDRAADLASAVDIGEARSFRVRARRAEGAPADLDVKALEARAGALIVERTGAYVDLNRPEVEVRLLLTQMAFAGLLGSAVDRSAMEARAVRHRPFSHPVSIHPKFARAMVNLARVPRDGTVADPFCGTGGILIEAALLGYKALGSDIDQRMVAGSRRNLEELGLEARLAQADVADFPEALGGPFDAVVTDPPYGRSTSTAGETLPVILQKLYRAAFEVLPPMSRLVICLPSADQLPGEGSGLSLESMHPLRVHRSLTRHITVLVREG